METKSNIKIIKIYDLARGETLLDVRSTTRKAIQYIIDQRYIDDNSSAKMGAFLWVPLTELFGKNWREKILDLSLNEFNDLAYGWELYLKRVELE